MRRSAVGIVVVVVMAVLASHVGYAQEDRDGCADHPREPETLLLVQTDVYIGRQEPYPISEQADAARPVTDAQLDLAVRSWAAFRQPTPVAWAQLL